MCKSDLMPTQALGRKTGFGGVIHQMGTETWYSAVKHKGFSASFEL